MRTFAKLVVPTSVLTTALALGCSSASNEGGSALDEPRGGDAAPASSTGATAPASPSTPQAPAGSDPTNADAGSAPTKGPPAAGCGVAPICESFEASAAVDANLWTTSTPNCKGTGVLALDESVAHGGKRSLKVTGGGGYCNHVFLATKNVASLGPTVYARFFVRFERALGDAHVTFAAFRDGREGKDLRVGGQNKILMWNRESDDATLPELSPTGISKSAAPEAQKWLCFEASIDTTAGQIRTWLDGRELEGLVADGMATADVDGAWSRKASWAPKIEDAKLGWESYGGDANTVWFDDIAFGTQRIGCSP